MKYKKTLIILIFSILSGTLSFANQIDCSPIDLRSQMSPVRDQGNIGWCYANAAADLLSFEFSDQLAANPISAIHVALTFTNTFIGQAEFEGGSAYLAVAAYLSEQDKLCLQSADEKLMSNGLKIPLKEKLNELKLFKQKFDAQKANPALRNDFNQEWTKIKNSNSYLFSMGDAKLVELLDQSSSEDFAKNVADTLCKKTSIHVDHKSEMIPLSGLTYLDKIIATQALNTQLTKHNIVGYAYRASVLTDPNVAQDWKSAHYSVLVGRKWNPKSNQCEYLIRNSWGNGCGSYKKSPVFKNRCEAGHVWMPENLLKRSMIGISYFRK